MSIAYLNGEFLALSEAKISVLDRGFLFADGVYEVIPVYSGIPFRLPEHLARLQRSLSAVKIKSNINIEKWQHIINQLISKNGNGHQSIYLQITRGADEKREHAFPENIEPTIFLMSMPMSVTDYIDPDTITGCKAITLPDIRWLRCDIKSISLLPNILLREQAIESNTQEAILLREDQVTEGAATNIFIVKNNCIFTPAIGHNILGGITRDLVIELIKENQLEIKEDTVTDTMLYNADEVWLTSSTKEIQPIIELNGKTVGSGKPGPMWRKVFTLYQNYKHKLLQNENEK